MELARHRILSLLSECTGETIWPVEYCRRRGVPEAWITESADAFESGFDRDRDTIYFDDLPINQFHGLRDVDLARHLARALRVDVDAIEARVLGRVALVQAIKEAVMEG